MPRICVIHPKRCLDSARKLAQALGADLSNPYKEKRINYSQYDTVINYGVSEPSLMGNLFNKPDAVSICKDKHRTFVYLDHERVPIPKFTAYAVIAQEFNGTIVCHTEQDGMQNKGIVYHERDNEQPIPRAYLYTEYFHHKREYRVVVLNYKVVGIYRKEEIEDGTWDLIPLSHKGFYSISNACVKAAKAIGIQYVGFDVVSNTREDFRILEANSGPIITDQVIDAFKQLFNK